MSIFTSVSRTLWGDLSKDEFKKFGLLSATLLFIVGSYWLLRPVKDALFMHIVGKVYLPYAKIASIIFLVPLILLYSKLVDIFEKHKLIYIITTCYGIFFICTAYLLTNPTIGIANLTPCKYRIFGWVIYLGVESFASLVVTLFWSFVTSSTDNESAKRGYALIFAGAQIGTIIGPSLAKHARQIGVPLLVFIAACGIMIISLMIKFFIKIYPQTINVAVKEKKVSTGFLEGLRLLFTKPYLIGTFGVATLVSIISIIIEYEMNYLAFDTLHSTEKVIEFLGLYGQTANFLTLLIALIGTSFIIRNYGLTFSLVTYPVIVGIVIISVWISPTLWVLFTAMVTIKCLGYALNSPSKEILYIQTSRDVKFKAKGWIDTFGDRSIKAVGGGINALFPIMTDLLFYGSIISLGVVGIWILAALYVGKKNYQLVQENKIIE